MSGPITLGEIRIFDNGNGVIDQADRITGLYNDEPILEDRLSTDLRVGYVKRVLGVDTLLGCPLQPAKQFMELLAETKRYAYDGEIEKVDERIPRLEEIARTNGFGFWEVSIKKIRRDALVNASNIDLQRAIALANRGSAETFRHLDAAGSYLLRAERECGIDTERFAELRQRIVHQVFARNPELKAAWQHRAEEAQARYGRRREREKEETRAAARAASEPYQRRLESERPVRERWRAEARYTASEAAARYRDTVQRYGDSVAAAQRILGTVFVVTPVNEKSLNQWPMEARFLLLRAVQQLDPPPNKDEVNQILFYAITALHEKRFRVERAEIDAVLRQAVQSVRSRQ